MDQINNQNVHLYILNEKNKLLDEKFIINKLKKYGVSYKIKNIQCFQRAMVHTSYLHKETCTEKTIKNLKDVDKILDPATALPLQDFSYERLEFLGDSVLHLIIAEYLFKRYPNQDEGFMTKLRTKLENGETLAILSKKLELNEYVVIARNIEQMGGRYNNTTILNNIFESFLGALYLESNYDTCRDFIVSIIEKEIDITEMIHKNKNYKDKIMQVFHCNKWKDPEYHHIDTIEIQGTKKFIIQLKKKENGEVIGQGMGTSKQKAEKAAAKASLRIMNVLENENSDDEDNNYYGT
jgi:dsRNA-specific ribonuclease